MKFIALYYYVLPIFLTRLIPVQLREFDNEINEIKKGLRFEIDRESNRFLKDGVPFRYISGTIHYFRVHPTDWRDRLRKLRYAGCNAVQTYIEWSSHEPEPGHYYFEENSNLLKFLSIAQEEGLLVILRPGPYIDAERDMGGLPYWLLRKNKDMLLRSHDPSYLYYVDRWFNVLYPLIKVFLYKNGGPVIMLQIENEFGTGPFCDFIYSAHLRDITKKILGNDVLLFTTDGARTNQLKCGRVAQVYATVDFGVASEEEVKSYFAVQRLFEQKGPLVNTEFYSGWIDHWGEPHSTRKTQDVVSTLDTMLAMNASVNIYVFHGGTSFGLKAGSNKFVRFQSCPTSYDFDAPLNEAGDTTDKYYAIRDVIKKYLPLPSMPEPSPSPKFPYGLVNLSPKGTVHQLNNILDTSFNKWPLTFEELFINNGIVIYSTIIPQMIPDPAILTLYEIHDRGYIFIDGVKQGIVSRESELYSLPIQARPNQTLSIVVESQGRICWGQDTNDFKGITTNVTLGSIVLQDWNMTAYSMSEPSRVIKKMMNLKTTSAMLKKGGMVFYSGLFKVPKKLAHPMDTFLRLDGWGKGYAWVNNFLLGRYWPTVGPQVTLYVPHGILKTGHNSILILELENAPCDQDQSCSVTFTDNPEIDGPTPQW